jgi:hypothetical protein
MMLDRTENGHESHSNRTIKDLLGGINMDNYAALDCIRTKSFEVLKIILERQKAAIEELGSMLR